jgi:membrane-bound lytic murein transglycosylase D
MAFAACSTIDPMASASATAAPSSDTLDASAAAASASAGASAPLGAAPLVGGASAPADAAAAPSDAASAAAEADAPVLPPYDPLLPEAPVNLDDRAAHADLWTRVRAGFAMPDLDTAPVREWEQWYASRPDYVARMTARGSKYLYHIVAEVERRHLPTELALLPFTESAFNPQAMSVAKASGMWQFIATTGRDFDLKQNVFRDDRRDVLASTRAALDYLEKLHGMFGDWQLALAAYNCGEGNVARAIARNQKAGLPTDYNSLNLPAETRGYVPKLQAVKNIVANPESFHLALPAVQNHPYFLSVPIERDMDVELAAKLAQVPIDEFRMLNPQLNKPVILAAGTPQVLLPYDNADNFMHNVKQHDGPLATWTAWVATRTVRPADAAKQVGMSEAQLREVNHIPNGMLVKAGSTLLVPRGASHTHDVDENVADSAAMMLAPDLPPVRRVNVRVAKGGETVASVARRYHLTPTQVAGWNHVGATAKFAAGTTVVVFTPAGTTRGIAAAPMVAQTVSPGATSSKGASPHAAATRVAASSKHGKAPSKGHATVTASAAKKPASHATAPVSVARRAPATATPAATATKVRTKAPVRVAQP